MYRISLQAGELTLLRLSTNLTCFDLSCGMFFLVRSVRYGLPAMRTATSLVLSLTLAAFKISSSRKSAGLEAGDCQLKSP